MSGTTYIRTMERSVLLGSSQFLHSVHRGCQQSCVSSLFSPKRHQNCILSKHRCLQTLSQGLDSPMVETFSTVTTQSSYPQDYPSKTHSCTCVQQIHPVQTIVALHSHGHSLSERIVSSLGFMLLSLYCPSLINRI